MSSEELRVRRSDGRSASRSRSPVLRSSVLALVLLAGCGVQRTPSSYTASVKKNFVSSCTTQRQHEGLSGPKGVCAACYEQIKKTIKFSDFKKINSDLTDQPKPLSGTLLNIVKDCSKSNESSGVASNSSTTSKPAGTTTTTR